jgi:hypothetical protein
LEKEWAERAAAEQNLQAARPGPDLPAAAELPAGQNGRPAGETRAASPIGAVTVLPWHEGAQASVLPRAYQDLLEVAADAGRPLRAGEFAAAAGLPSLFARSVSAGQGPSDVRCGNARPAPSNQSVRDA